MIGFINALQIELTVGVCAWFVVRLIEAAI